MKHMYGRPIILMVVVSLLWARFDRHKPLYAQESCNSILTQLEYSIQPNTCESIGDNNACYGSDSIASSFKGQPDRTWTLGQEVGIGDLQSFATQSPYGVGFLVLKNPGSDPVKVVAFGNTDVTQHDGQVLALHGTGNDYLCDRTPSGLIAQTEQHDTGYINVNGVRIKLGSTALITVDSIVLFDDAPRDNRKGGGNYFCSGFESDCSFGNCSPNQRLIYGLYCRENSYSYVGKGLYRVTVHGQGAVTAGATDYGVSNESFSLGSQEMTLPGSYTFWWPGLRPGSYGFEPVVISRDLNARVDHVTLEYLGEGTAS
ncbi:MAG: hypothetical protein KDE58_22465, partial [Caldilineaceae bacterium]|nr:hypothetical protein [Caldilineaceae bacterium]